MIRLFKSFKKGGCQDCTLKFYATNQGCAFCLHHYAFTFSVNHYVLFTISSTSVSRDLCHRIPMHEVQINILYVSRRRLRDLMTQYMAHRRNKRIQSKIWRRDHVSSCHLIKVRFHRIVEFDICRTDQNIGRLCHILLEV